jgi:hypothetical protein
MTQKNGKAFKGICHASHIVPEIASNFVTPAGNENMLTTRCVIIICQN